MAKRKMPKVKTYVILEQCLEEGLRGFLYNDIEKVTFTDEEIDYLVERAVNRIVNAFDERFEL